ncbi:MAG TPA: GH116 family glycosyl-hydrolase, partial [Clostridia bacterium]|nr:GH116 family glycosyl-hydrolase [Clostridia bacterium]
RGAELEMIGMPIGGICAGQIYLGGDGKLWHWDIFNQRVSTGAEHYAKPLPSTSPLDQGFALTITSGEATQKRPLDHKHWREVSFTGEYPIGFVEYRDPELPVTVSLEAFSPFIPLNTDDSSLPATVLEFTVKNQSGKKVQCELSGWLENAACLYSGQKRSGVRRNRVTREGDLLALECSAEDVAKTPVSTREDIVFESFERASYENWSATGTAFGTGPVELPRVPSYQGDVGGKGQRAVNSHASAPGDSIEQKDSTTGSLVSRSFTITRDYITFLIGGGSHKGKTCMNLVVDGQIVLSATGENNNRMQPVTWDVRRWAGKSATLHIVDNESGPWGNVGVDEIVFTDTPSRPLGPLAEEADFGTLSLALLNPQKSDLGLAAADQNEAGESKDGTVTRTFDQKLVGLVGRKMTLAPGASAKATFILAWHMPNVKLSRLPEKRHYAARFRSAKEVAKYISGNFTRLSSQTRLWHDTWYDSTLPYWFLDRTFLNTSILASSTCHRFADGRFYAWEGVGCCEGTCGHVWQYAHAVGRLFPELERITRERVDFGLALQPSGAIHFRGEFNDIPAIDAQAGTILRALREHQVSSDNQFLKRNWPKIKQATEWLIAKDTKSNGLIETNQHNTLDTDWFGPVAWLSGLYLSALLAAESMALEMDDKDFASKCLQILEVGQKNLVEQLFDGEYFINKPDPKHLDAINSGTGCEIDQVFGQSWAFQVGL